MSENDYKYSLYSERPDYGVTPKFVDTDQSSGFQSLYKVTKETAEAITRTGTAKGFKGIVWSSHLQLDIDSYEAADRVEARLKELGYGFSSFDTGGRGAHFSIMRDCYPSHLLPNMDKQWVQQNIPEADSSIYTHLHPFRLPGTPHHRTGKRKCFVASFKGNKSLVASYSEEVKIYSGASFTQTTSKSIFDQFFIQRNSEPAKEGERHPQLIRLIYALKDNGYDINIARWWVNEVNKRFQPPKSKEEIEKALGSIYR